MNVIEPVKSKRDSRMNHNAKMGNLVYVQLHDLCVPQINSECKTNFKQGVVHVNHTFQDSTAKGACSVLLAQSLLPQTSLPKASQLADVHHYHYSKNKSKDTHMRANLNKLGSSS